MKQKFTGLKELILERGRNYVLIDRVYNQTLLRTLYSMGDIFTICSSWENFPTTCIEAQCCGVPVSGFDRCGTKETVITEYGKRKNAEKLSEDNQMETFVEYGDIEALTEVTKKLLENGNEKTQLSNIAKKCYSKEQMSNAYLNLYQEIM